VQNQAFYRTGIFGNFFLGGGILRFQNGNSQWPWSQYTGSHNSLSYDTTDTKYLGLQVCFKKSKMY